MKQFFKSVAATVVGIFAFGIIMGIFTFISLIGMLMSGDKPSLRDNSVMVMKLQGKSDCFVDENTLSVNVNRLRKKLADADLEDFILTKKGIGYRLK